MFCADDLADAESEFVCTAAPPPCDHRADDDLGEGPHSDDAELREELAAARKRGDHEAVSRIEHCFAVSRQVNPENDPRGSKAWQRAIALGKPHRERGHQAKRVPPVALRTARPRGAGRPRASASRSSAKSGDGSGDLSGGEPPGLAALLDGSRA